MFGVVFRFTKPLRQISCCSRGMEPCERCQDTRLKSFRNEKWLSFVSFFSEFIYCNCLRNPRKFHLPAKSCNTTKNSLYRPDNRPILGYILLLPITQAFRKAMHCMKNLNICSLVTLTVIVKNMSIFLRKWLMTTQIQRNYDQKSNLNHLVRFYIASRIAFYKYMPSIRCSLKYTLYGF